MERQDDPVAESPAVETTGAAAPSGREAPEPVNLSVPSESRYIRLARLVAAGLANELGYGVDRLDDVRLAVGEACGVAAHAGASRIAITYLLDADRLVVTVDADLPGAADLDSDYLALVEQVLAVACSEHDVGRDGRKISARLVFSDGS